MSVKTKSDLTVEQKNKLLKLEFGNNHMSSFDQLWTGHTSKGKLALVDLGNRAQIKPWKDKFRYNLKWKDVKEDSLKGFNFFLSLNPDPSVDWYVHERDKKSLIPRYLELLEELKFKYIIKSSLSIYEYGRYGEKGGRIHFHSLIKTDQKNELVKQMLKIFNNRTNCKHRTVQCRHLRSVDDRNYQFNIYMRKEEHNKERFLFKN